MSLPLSAHAREAVDRMNAYRQRQRDLQVRRDTAIRARILHQQAIEHARRLVTEKWDAANNPPAHRHSTDSIPAQILAYLYEHGEAHASRLALQLHRSYDATRKALERMQQAGEVAGEEKGGTVWWSLNPDPPPLPDPVPANRKLDMRELADHVTRNPGATIYEVADVFRSHPETIGRRFRELREAGVLVDAPADGDGPARWYPAGTHGVPERGRVVRRADVHRYVKTHPGCTTADVAQHLACRPESVRRVMNKMVHAGVLRNRDAGRGNIAHWEVAG